MKVSVIIPSYNEEKDISNCLLSLKEQSFKDFEIILVDDGSTDKTIKIAEEISKSKKIKLKILKQNHQGPGKARNFGARNAEGEILVLIDSDMTFEKNYIKNLISPLLEDKEGNIIGTTHDYEIAVNTDSWISDLWGRIRVSKDDAKNVKIFRAIRKSKFLELGGFDQRYGYADDQTLWFKYKIKPFVAENTICYHRNPSTLNGTYNQARWIGASWKERFIIFKIPLLNYIACLALFILIPFAAILKIFSNKKYKKTRVFRFYFYKFLGYASGINRAVWLSKVWK